MNKAHTPTLAVILGVVACGGGSGGTEVSTYTDPDELTLIEMPGDWHLYDFEEINQLDELPFVETVQNLDFPVESVVAFDGAPVKDVTNLAEDLATVDYPIGAATIRTIGDGQRDFVSRFVMTHSALPYLSLPNPDEIEKEDFSFGDGYDGTRVLVSFSDAEAQNVGVAYMISVTDATDDRLFSVVAGCSRQCFIDRQADIESVVDSWLVNTRA